MGENRLISHLRKERVKVELSTRYFMSKIANAILMIEYLKTGKKYSIKQLSEKLNISERMVRYYKTELTVAGFPIESFTGPNGGYFMLKPIHSYYSFTKYDIQLIENIHNFAKLNNYKLIDDFSELINKIERLYDIHKEINRIEFDIENENNGNLKQLLKKAIQNNEKIEIFYKDLDNTINRRIISPIYLFNYKEHYYVTAFCDLRKDIRHFELKRIIIK